MPDKTVPARLMQAGEGESRKPFVAPVLEEMGTLTIVTQLTVALPP